MAKDDGGGMATAWSIVVIENSDINGNQASFGGGMHLYNNSKVFLSNSIFSLLPHEYIYIYYI